MTTSDVPPNAPPPVFVRALRRVLRPLVRLMLAQGVTYPYLINLLKGLFVEVADQDFQLGGKPSTDSRVSLVSGVHRKDVSRLRLEMQSQAEQVPPVVSLGAQLVALWLGSPQYVDESGAPKPLHRFASEGGDVSFETLVTRVNNDIRPRVVLDEWLRLGVVQLDDQRRVCLNTSAFVPAEGFEEKVFFFGHNLHDHTCAVVSNLLGSGTPFLERSVYYDELSREGADQLRQQAEQVGMHALLAINQTAMQLEQQAKDKSAQAAGTPQHRMTFGVYFYTEVMPGEPPLASEQP